MLAWEHINNDNKYSYITFRGVLYSYFVHYIFRDTGNTSFDFNEVNITNKLLTLIIALFKQNNYDKLNIWPLLLIANDNRNNDYYKITNDN